MAPDRLLHAQSDNPRGACPRFARAPVSDWHARFSTRPPIDADPLAAGCEVAPEHRPHAKPSGWVLAVLILFALLVVVAVSGCVAVTYRTGQKETTVTDTFMPDDKGQPVLATRTTVTAEKWRSASYTDSTEAQKGAAQILGTLPGEGGLLGMVANLPVEAVATALGITGVGGPIGLWAMLRRVKANAQANERRVREEADKAYEEAARTYSAPPPKVPVATTEGAT